MINDNEFFDEESYTPEELIKRTIKFDTYIEVVKAVKKWGLEHAEDKIKELYNNMPKVKETMLKTLYAIWGK